MSRIPPFARGMIVIALIAGAVVVLNQETALNTASTLVRFAFYIAIAFAAYLLWRDFGRREIALWPTRQQRVFYGAIALFLVDLGWWFATRLTGRDLLAFFVTAGACIYAAVRTWREQHRYS
jgi:hypothetical protein